MWQSIGIAVTLLIVIANTFIVIIMKINDLKHAEISIEKLDCSIQKLDGKIDNLGERVSKIEGYHLAKKEIKSRKK
jgi:hypothetical protein